MPLNAAAAGAVRFCTGLAQLLRLVQVAGDTARRGKSLFDFSAPMTKRGRAQRGGRSTSLAGYNEIPSAFPNWMRQDAHLSKRCCMNPAQKPRSDNDKTYGKSRQGAQVKRKVMVGSSARMLALCLVNSGY